jgi:hypothetical protein
VLRNSCIVFQFVWPLVRLDFEIVLLMFVVFCCTCSLTSTTNQLNPLPPSMLPADICVPPWQVSLSDQRHRCVPTNM